MKRQEVLTIRQLANILDVCNTTAHTWTGRFTLSKYLTTTIEGRRNVKFKLNQESYKEFIKFLKSTGNTRNEIALRKYWESKIEQENRLHSVWFTPITGECIGIVRTPTNKTYIGVGNGKDEEADKKYIAQYGTPIDLKMVIKLLEMETE